jgi:hypothetical protein
MHEMLLSMTILFIEDIFDSFVPRYVTPIAVDKCVAATPTPMKAQFIIKFFLSS